MHSSKQSIFIAASAPETMYGIRPIFYVSSASYLLSCSHQYHNAWHDCFALHNCSLLCHPLSSHSSLILDAVACIAQTGLLIAKAGGSVWFRRASVCSPTICIISLSCKSYASDHTKSAEYEKPLNSSCIACESTLCTGVKTGVTLVNSESKLLVSVAFLICGMNGGGTRL